MKTYDEILAEVSKEHAHWSKQVYERVAKNLYKCQQSKPAKYTCKKVEDLKVGKDFIDFNDERIPIGKRKVAYVRFAMMNGTSMEQAKKQANRKFGW